MSLFYQLGIRFYFLVAQIAALFNEKARLFTNGQKVIFETIEKRLNRQQPVIWIHCASLGEFEQGRPLIEKIKQQYPNYQVVLTFYSPSGYEIRKNYKLADCICYLPADTPKKARRFIDLIHPEKAFFIKYEYWYNYFRILKQKDIPIYMVSAIFRENQLFFSKGFRGQWYRKILQNVEHFFVQNDQSGLLLSQIGLNNFTVNGDTRFDRVAEIASNSKDLPRIEQFKAGQRLIVAGSSWPPDEGLLIDFLKQNTDVKIIFAPHEVNENNILRLQKQIPMEAAIYSLTEGQDLSYYRVLIIDRIGILSSIYGYADIAYVGGGFGVGIHNTLEAAIYKIPVVFGPNYQKFQEARGLEDSGVAFPIENSAVLNNTLNRLLEEEKTRRDIATKCEKFMAKNLGATQQVLTKVFNIS
ncbi:MAG TPA: glycosyltransferase N-terminal domain-containing protein [Sunxiuqinia sp.]|nr:glycosyltransferase N-terminal domain-containing protein [Sunxiuqinia sp.]